MTDRDLDHALENGQRLVVVSGPEGIDPSAALFSAGFTLSETDIIVTRRKRGNVQVDIWDRRTRPAGSLRAALS